MARISISKASQDFNISRNTLYKYIKQGKITKHDGKLDTVDLVRLFGSTVTPKQNTEQSKVSTDTNIEHIKQENEQLKQQLSISELRINELREQLDYMKTNEAWLKSQLDQKLIENKSTQKKGILGRLFN